MSDGPRQAALVDALTHRLGYGPPMSEADEHATALLVRLLGPWDVERGPLALPPTAGGGEQ